MKIRLQDITIRQVVEGFEDNDEYGVFGYSKKLNIRPPYQREFVYERNLQEAVIDTIFHGYPLNVMYWIANQDGSYELLDGQQRTLSFCYFYSGKLTTKINGRMAGFDNLSHEEQELFLNYPLQIYICTDGTTTEQLAWFKTINIASKALTSQELRNAIYTGTWITDAKKFFSKNNCVAKRLGDRFINKKYNRQECLELVLKWVANANGLNGSDGIEQYMTLHQNDSNANSEWKYFQDVIAWIQWQFPKYRIQMKGLDWGILYNKYKHLQKNPTENEEIVDRLMRDKEVQHKSGIYEYIYSGNEKSLNIRLFDDDIKQIVYDNQHGVCAKCGNPFQYDEMEGDHIIPWSEGGKTVLENCQMLCINCNRLKNNK